MVLNLRMFLVASILVYMYIIFYFLRKRNLNIKYTLLWLFSAVIMLIVTIFPSIINFIAHILGVIDPVNIVFTIEGMFSLLILLSLTLIVSDLNHKFRILAQNMGLMEERLRRLEDEHDELNHTL